MRARTHPTRPPPPAPVPLQSDATVAEAKAGLRDALGIPPGAVLLSRSRGGAPLKDSARVAEHADADAVLLHYLNSTRGGGCGLSCGVPCGGVSCGLHMPRGCCDLQ